MSKKYKLMDIVNTLLDSDAKSAELAQSVKSLAEIFEQFASVINSDEYSGVAISPLDAICANEHVRITKYMRGVYAAVNDLLKRFKGQKIRLLYAGCGPHATLLLPLLYRFDPKRLSVRFLDHNAASLKSVKAIMSHLGFEKFAEDYIHDNASSYQSEEPLHMVLVDSMNAALYDKPQVALTLNLLPQLQNGGVFIPKRVVVGFETAYYNQVKKRASAATVKYSNYLCHILDIDTAKPLTKEQMLVTDEYRFKSEIDAKMEPQLSTVVYIYKNNILRENECSLTIPKKMNLSTKLVSGARVTFDYLFDNAPQIAYRLSMPLSKERWNDWLIHRERYRSVQTQSTWREIYATQYASLAPSIAGV